MINNEEYERLINGLSQESFNLLIKEYAKEYYDTNELHISNGPYDGGLDLVYFKNEKEIKKNIQITVEKNKYETKILDDLAKAKSNVQKYAYQANLDFYISTSISQSKKNELIRIAEVDFDITLKIIDGRKLSHDMEQFSSIKKSINKIYNFSESQEIFNLSKQEKILFNVIASGEDSSKIKRHLIHAYIITTLFEYGALEIEELYSKIKDNFSTNLTIQSLLNEVNYLKSKQSITGKSVFDLTQTSRTKLQDILDLNNFQEKILSDEIRQLLSSYKLSEKANEIAKNLKEMYINHFNYDIEEYDKADNSFLKSTRAIYHELISNLGKNGIEDNELKIDIANKIIDLASKNEFLTKIGASSMYVKLFNSNKIDEFIKKSNRKICIDTQVLLRMICVLHSTYSNDQSIRSVNRFLQIIQDKKARLDLFTTIDYISEVAGHLQNALKIYNFLKLPLFKDLGHSRNVFYNHYTDLFNNGLIDDKDFRSFVEKDLLDMAIPSEFDEEFIEVVAQRFTALFENLDYEVISPSIYSTFQDVKKEFETELSYNNQRRSKKAIVHDVRTAIYLSDEQNHFDKNIELYVEPYLITWDFQFFNLRAVAKKKLKDFSNWFIYPPQKFIEKMLLSEFKIKPEAINETIISMVEFDFNYTNTKKTFLDVISTIFNRQDIPQLKLAQKLANMEIEYKTQEESRDDFHEIDGEESPLTIILSILVNHYYNPETTNSMRDFTNLCQDNDKADALISLISKSVLDQQKNELNIKNLIKEIDLLMKK